MRKVMLLAAMLAMVLAAAAPALAQQIGGDQGPVAGDDAVQAGDNVQYAAVCQNILGAFDAAVGQYGTADADAVAGENAAVVSEVAQSQGVSVSQVNECLNATATASPSPPPSSPPSPPPSPPPSATVLPPTGGIVPSSALALGAGALLVGGGLLARRIVR